MTGILVEAQMTGCRPLADRSMSVTFHTKELPKDDKAELIEHLSSAGWLLFKDNEIQDEDIPKQDAELETKTPGQRLRASIYVWWDQSGKKGEFETFYRETMEKFIVHIKNKLI